MTRDHSYTDRGINLELAPKVLSSMLINLEHNPHNLAANASHAKADVCNLRIEVTTSISASK